MLKIIPPGGIYVEEASVADDSRCNRGSIVSQLLEGDFDSDGDRDGFGAATAGRDHARAGEHGF